LFMVQRCKFSIELKNFPPDLSGEPQFGLENRIVTDMNKMQKILETPIDYAGVNKIIMEETKRSITYLTQNIR
jgi:hypothetical protein